MAFRPAKMKGSKPGVGTRVESDLITHLQQTRKALSREYMALDFCLSGFVCPTRQGAACGQGLHVFVVVF